MAEMTNDLTNETLITDYMEATGCDEDYAMEVLAMALSGSELKKPEHLPALVPMLTSDNFPAPMAVTCMAGLYQFERTEAGREMLFYKAMSIMQRAGISEKLGNALLVAIPRMIAQGRKTTARGN